MCLSRLPRRIASVFCAVAALVASAHRANAPDVTFRFSGVVTRVDFVPFADISVGTPFVGTYTFNVGAGNQGSIPQVGDYMFRSAPSGVVVVMGSHVFRTNPNNVMFLIETVNDYSGFDNYLFRSYNNLPVDGAGIGTIGLQLDDPTQTALSSIDLSATPPVLSQWQQGTGFQITGIDFSFFIQGEVTAIAVCIEGCDIAPPPGITMPT